PQRVTIDVRMKPIAHGFDLSSDAGRCVPTVVHTRCFATACRIAIAQRDHHGHGLSERMARDSKWRLERPALEFDAYSEASTPARVSAQYRSPSSSSRSGMIARTIWQLIAL